MKQRIDIIYRLGIKELFSLRYDLFLVFLIYLSILEWTKLTFSV